MPALCSQIEIKHLVHAVYIKEFVTPQLTHLAFKVDPLCVLVLNQPWFGINPESQVFLNDLRRFFA